MKVPVGMASPLNVKSLGQVELQFNPPAYQLIHDSSVIDPLDRYQGAVGTAIVQLVPLGNEIGDVDNLDSKVLLCHTKVGQGLLIQRVDVGQNHIFGVLALQNNLTQHPPVRLLGMAVEEAAQRGIEMVNTA